MRLAGEQQSKKTDATRQRAQNAYEADKPAKPLSGSRGDNPTTGAGSCIVMRT